MKSEYVFQIEGLVTVREKIIDRSVTWKIATEENLDAAWLKAGDEAARLCAMGMHVTAIRLTGYLPV